MPAPEVTDDENCVDSVEGCAERGPVVQIGSNNLNTAARDVFRLLAIGAACDGADLPLVVLGEAVEH